MRSCGPSWWKKSTWSFVSGNGVTAMRQVVVAAAISEAEVCPGRDGKSPAWLSWSRMIAQRCRRSEVAKSDRGSIRVNESPSCEAKEL